MITSRTDPMITIRCRKFYTSYQNAEIVATPLPQLENLGESAESKEDMNCGNAVAPIRLPRFILSWSHYLILMRIENIEARSFYEIEAAQQNWSVSQLSRQVGSSLYERLALSRNKDEVVRYALNRSMSPTMVALYKEQLQVGGVIQRSLVEFCKFVNKGKKK